MANPTISVANASNRLDDRDLQRAIRSVNRQLVEDFQPIWGRTWELMLHGSPTDFSDVDSLVEEHVRGEAVIYVVDEPNLAGAVGYHALNAAELPYGFVFLLGDDWTITLSHEAMELIIDPTANVLVPGPDPRDHSNIVLHAHEVCDAVERTSYLVDDVRVSNFVTPQWFFAGNAPGTRDDFLGVGVNSFDATPNSHLGFFDPSVNSWITYLGTTGSIMPRFHGRAEHFCSVRHRPNEGSVNAVLLDLQESPPECLHAKVGELRRMAGITRTDRHSNVVTKLFDAARAEAF